MPQWPYLPDSFGHLRVGCVWRLGPTLHPPKGCAMIDLNGWVDAGLASRRLTAKESWKKVTLAGNTSKSDVLETRDDVLLTFVYICILKWMDLENPFLVWGRNTLPTQPTRLVIDWNNFNVPYDVSDRVVEMHTMKLNSISIRTRISALDNMRWHSSTLRWGGVFLQWNFGGNMSFHVNVYNYNLFLCPQNKGLKSNQIVFKWDNQTENSTESKISKKKHKNIKNHHQMLSLFFGCFCANSSDQPTEGIPPNGGDCKGIPPQGAWSI